MTKYRAAQAISTFAALLCFSVTTHAQSTAKPAASGGFPDRPIRVIVGNAPGGGSDITSRRVTEKLGERLGQAVIVDNRAGANGVIAINAVAQSAPNGYTLLVVAGGDLASLNAQKKLTYDVRAAFLPITQLTSQYYLLLSSPSLPVASLKEVIDYAKAHPRALSFGSAGVGSAGHAGLELMKFQTDTNIVHVPYKGIAPALTDMIGGQLHLAFVSTISGAPHVASGKLRALAVTSLRRAKAYPDLPAVAEAGAPGFELTNWYGLFGPAGIPRPILDVLFQQTTQVLSTPEMQSQFSSSGADATPSASPAEFAQALEREVTKWQNVMRLPGFAEGLQ